MEARILLEALGVAERLKDATRHCYTKNGRHESVAEHSWVKTLPENYATEMIALYNGMSKRETVEALKTVREEVRKDTLKKLEK